MRREKRERIFLGFTRAFYCYLFYDTEYSLPSPPSWLLLLCYYHLHLYFFHTVIITCLPLPSCIYYMVCSRRAMVRYVYWQLIKKCNNLLGGQFRKKARYLFASLWLVCFLIKSSRGNGSTFFYWRIFWS